MIGTLCKIKLGSEKHRNQGDPLETLTCLYRGPSKDNLITITLFQETKA